MVRRVEKLINLRDGHVLVTVGYLFNRITGAEFTLLKNPQVEARSAMGHHQRGHLLMLHSDS